MNSYRVSARKYRPSRFAEVIGQEHVTKTLKNAIKFNQLAHSFLFCGPRGVGKTTCARILAKTINCENVQGEEACDECNSCKSFNESSSFNIHELDAASNNTVDDIRNLIDQVRFPPQTGKYKIYIIDEVHMLSQQAFNAFLKTLEEPPSYAIFILATTEKHKIIPTILSRCQIFDFRRVTVDTIVGHLQKIAGAEKRTADEDALHIIAQKSDGSVRDALSMFDRLTSFSGEKLSYESVLENLNVLDYDYFFRVTDALLGEDISTVLLLLDEVLSLGFEGDHFIIGLSEHFRNLMMCQDERTLPLLEVGAKLRQRYADQAAVVTGPFLLNGLRFGNECDVQYKQAKNKRLCVELALMRMCFAQRMVEPVAQPVAQAGAATAVSVKKNEDREGLMPEPGQALLTKAPEAPAPSRTIESAVERSDTFINPPAQDSRSDVSAPAAPGESSMRIVKEESPELGEGPAPASPADVSAPEPVLPPEPSVDPVEAEPVGQDDAPAVDVEPVSQEGAPAQAVEPEAPVEVEPMSQAEVPPAVVAGGLRQKEEEPFARSGKLSSLENIRKHVESETAKAAAESATEGPEEEAQSIEVSQEKLLEAWTRYAGKMKEEKRHSLHNLMSNFLPSVEEGRIQICVESGIQEELLSNEKLRYLEYFRKELKLPRFNLDIKVDKSKVTGEKVPYTSKDKYEKMIQDNPKIKDLKNRLGLELDF